MFIIYMRKSKRFHEIESQQYTACRVFDMPDPKEGRT